MVRFPTDEAARHAMVDLLVSNQCCMMQIHQPAAILWTQSCVGVHGNEAILASKYGCQASSSLPLFLDAQGDLALLARPGGRGMPAGHIVAYRPTHTLHAAFLHQLQQAIDSCPACPA